MGFSRHAPVVRHVSCGFEVVCGECGDDGGDLADQPEDARRLRGPYRDRDAARDAATRHRAFTERDW